MNKTVYKFNMYKKEVYNGNLRLTKLNTSLMGNCYTLIEGLNYLINYLLINQF